MQFQDDLRETAHATKTINECQEQAPQTGGRQTTRRRTWTRTRDRRDHSNKEDSRPESEQSIEIEGTIKAVLAGTMFKVELANGHEVLAHISGKMRKRFIRLVVGDQVKMEMSPYDKDKARITYRL